MQAQRAKQKYDETRGWMPGERGQGRVWRRKIHAVALRVVQGERLERYGDIAGLGIELGLLVVPILMPYVAATSASYIVDMVPIGHEAIPVPGIEGLHEVALWLQGVARWVLGLGMVVSGINLFCDRNGL